MNDIVEQVIAILADTRDNFVDRVTAHNIVWSALERAAETVDRLPDRELAWLKNDSKVWSMASLSAPELRQMAKAHLMAGVKPEFRPAMSMGADLDHAMVIMDWFGFCRQGDDDRLQKAAYHLAAHRPDVAAAHFRPGAVGDRRTVTHIKTLACAAILSKFKTDYGIELSNDGMIFVDSGL